MVGAFPEFEPKHPVAKAPAKPVVQECLGENSWPCVCELCANAQGEVPAGQIQQAAGRFAPIGDQISLGIPG